MKKITNKKLLFQTVTAGGLGIISALSISCAGGETNKKVSQSEQARTQEQILNEVQSVKAIGKVVPAEDWIILSAPKSAQVLKVLVREGDSVTEGQLLVELNPSNSSLTIEEAR